MKPVPVTSATPKLPLSALCESALNPRTKFAGLDELANTIRANGIIHALVVRPLTTVSNGVTHEIVAGARRYRASKLAGLSEVPVHIRILTDEEADDIRQIENLHRIDLTPLEEAAGYSRLLSKSGQTVETIATRVGKPPRYIAARLSLLKLNERAQTALAEDRIGLPHALKIAALPEALHDEALAACFAEVWNAGRQQALLPVAQLEKWIEQNVMLSLKAAPFDKSSDTLVSSAGSCDHCPKRTGANRHLFGDAAEDDRCMDRACLQAKTQAHIETMTSQRPDLIRISTRTMMNSKEGTLGTNSFVIVEPKKNSKKPEHRKCEHMQDAIVVHGHDAGSEHIVCADPTCTVHHQPQVQTPSAEAEDYRQKQRDEQRELRLKLATRRAIGDAILKKAKTLKNEDWRLIVNAAVNHIPHEYRIDLCKRHGCYPKEKQPSSMDMIRNLGNHVDSLDATGCQRFLFDIALLGDIKSHYRTDADANLRKIATRFNVDIGAITKEVRANLKAKVKTKAASKTNTKGAA